MLGQVLGALVLALVGVCIYRGHVHPLAQYPGPFWARYTNLWRFVVYFQGHGHLVDAELHARYGPVVRTGPNSLSFSTLEAFNTIYTIDRVFEKGSFYDFARDPHTGYGGSFTSRTSKDVRSDRRRATTGAFSGRSIAGYRPTVARVSSETVRLFDEALQQSTDGRINIAAPIHRLGLNLNFEVVHGKSLDDLPERYHASIREDMHQIIKFSFALSFLPILGYIISSRPGFAFLRRPQYDPDTHEPAGFTALYLRSVDAVGPRKSEITAPESQPSILKAWLAVDPSETTRRMNQYQLGVECMNFVLAGHNSTSTALIAIFHALGTTRGRPWQQKVYEELATMEGRANMSATLLAVVKETLRLNPPFPRGWPREVAPGAEVVMPGTDRPLPSGTMVYSGAYIIGRSTDVWGADAAEWKPERWLAASKSAEAKSLESAFVAFGKGARVCMGRDIAMSAILEMTAQVLERWEMHTEGELAPHVDFEARYDDCPVTFTAR